MKSLIETINSLPLDGESAGGHEFLEKSKVIQVIDNQLQEEKRVKYYLNKIDNHEELNEQELECLICDYEIEAEQGEDHRWQREMTSIIQLDDRFFLYLLDARFNRNAG